MSQGGAHILDTSLILLHYVFLIIYSLSVLGNTLIFVHPIFIYQNVSSSIFYLFMASIEIHLLGVISLIPVLRLASTHV